MASQDILRQLEEAAEQQAQALDLTELYYSIPETAHILKISRAKLDSYLKNDDYQIQKVGFENSRKKYVLAEDIRKLYLILHIPFLSSGKDKLHLPPRAPQPPQVRSASELALARHLGEPALQRPLGNGTLPRSMVTNGR